MISQYWPDLLWAAGTALNTGLLVYNWRMARQYYRLNRLLLDIAVKSFFLQRIAPVYTLFPNTRITANIEVHRD